MIINDHITIPSMVGNGPLIGLMDGRLVPQNGGLMIIKDHINISSMVGKGPLIGLMDDR